jgi:hypothetical protein
MSYTTDCSGYRIILEQKKQFAIFNAAPPRAETASPYGNYTKAQLDMRRKAEVLKHSNNRQNTKTNNLTKNQHWAMLARGSGTRISQYAIQAQNDPNVSGFEVIQDKTNLDAGTTVIVNGIGYRVFGDEFAIGTRVIVHGPGYDYNNMTKFVEVKQELLGKPFSSQNFIGPDSSGQTTTIQVDRSQSNLTVQHDGSYGTIIGLFPDLQQYQITYDGFISDIVDFSSMTRLESAALARIPYVHVQSPGTIVNAIPPNQYTVQYSDATTDVVDMKDLTAIRISPYKCLQDITKPTWTSACDVPGPPMKLYMDPSVPLYGFSSQPATSGQGNGGGGAGNVAQDGGDVLVKFYTQNELEYVFKEVEISSQPDIVSDNVPYQTRGSRIGQIVTTDRMEPSLYHFEFSIPIGIWFYGSTGFGVLNTQNCPTLVTDPLDLSYNPHVVDVVNSLGETVQVEVEYDNACYEDRDVSGTFRYPAPFLPGDAIRMHVLTQKTADGVDPFALKVKYSGNLLPTKDVTFEPSFSDVTFSAYDIEPGHFYGVQYVGNVMIRNLNLQVQPQQVFELEMALNYTYNTNVSNLFDYFKTGIFVNLSQDNQYAADGMTFTSPPRFPFIESTFTNYTPGSSISKKTPSILYKSIQFGNVGPTFANIKGIGGNFDSYTVHREGPSLTHELVGVGFQPPSHDISRNFPNLTGAYFYDSGLMPETSYTYYMTPVLNHMNGSLYQIGTVHTPKLEFRVSDPSMQKVGIYFPNIRGNFSSYTVQQDVSAVSYERVRTRMVQQIRNVTTLSNHLTMPSYRPLAPMTPGLTYQYTFTPYSFNYQGPSISFSLSSPNPQITHAVFGEITNHSVEIKEIRGVFDSYCVVRDGIPSRAAIGVKPKNQNKISDSKSVYDASYVDVGNGLIPGNQYRYSIIPTFDDVKLDGIRYYLPNPAILPLV